MSKKRFNYSDFCQSCRQALHKDSKIVYVEDDSNRYFCSEDCIRKYYDPMAEHYRKEMMTLRNPHDVPVGDFPKYESYAPLCLSEPHEVWQDQTENKETIHYYIGEFANEGGKFYYIVSCFCMQGEPTYILLSFPTRDKKLVEEFRKGEKLEREEESTIESDVEVSSDLTADFLARQGAAIEEEMMGHRRKEDVPKAEFEDYNHLIESTIESPDEVWELQDGTENTLLTLISQQDDSLSYIVICALDANIEDQESWKVVYSFPTKDQALVQKYRRGLLREGTDRAVTLLH